MCFKYLTQHKLFKFLESLKPQKKFHHHIFLCACVSVLNMAVNLTLKIILNWKKIYWCRNNSKKCVLQCSKLVNTQQAAAAAKKKELAFTKSIFSHTNSPYLCGTDWLDFIQCSHDWCAHGTFGISTRLRCRHVLFF